MKTINTGIQKLAISLCLLGVAEFGLAQEGGAQTLEVTPGAPTYLNVSSRMVNELIVPYSNARLVKFLHPDTTASIDRDGKSIYVSTGTEEFIQLIIKNADAPDQPGISLALLPAEDVPPQHIFLKPVGSGPTGIRTEQTVKLASENYEDMLRELIREAARDSLPQGYTEDAGWRGMQLQVGTVVGAPAKRLVGNSLAVEYFDLKNIGATAVELIEPNYKRPGVRAIAFIHDVLLAPGASTRMVWVRDL